MRTLRRSESGWTVAVVGATGAVGREMVTTLEARDFPVERLRLYASPRSAGQTLSFHDREVEVEALPDSPPDDVGIALFSAGSAVSKAVAERWAGDHAVVIDNSSAWRMVDGVPLVVPEVNGIRVWDAVRGRGIIANPNCSTIQLVVAVAPLMEAFGDPEIVVSTYQSVSGAGQKGMEELSAQVVAMFHGKDASPQAFAHPIGFNCIPAIGPWGDLDYTEEEWKLVRESRKILDRPLLRVAPTAVRVPTFACHAESVRLRFPRKVTPKEARAALLRAEGVVVLDRPLQDEYPMGLPLAGSDDVHVGRIRQDPSDDQAILLWVVADNLRKGAALNAVQIAELIDGGPEDDA